MSRLMNEVKKAVSESEEGKRLMMDGSSDKEHRG